MVRANELGCRNGWNADLWVPANTDESSTERVQPRDSIGGRARSEVGPAQQTDLITSIVAAKTDNAILPAERPKLAAPPHSAVEEDIFVKQTPSLSWSNGPVSSQPASELVQDPKAAILRARDQFRERRKTEGRLADRQIAPPPAPMLASSREARLVDELDLTEPDPAPESVDPRYENRPLLRPAPVDAYDSRRPVAPVTRREIDRPFPSMTEFPEDRVRFESVPYDGQYLDEEALMDIEPDDMWLETRQIDTIPPEPYVVDELFDEDELGAYVETEPYQEESLVVRHRESPLNRFFRQRRERRDRTSLVEERHFEETPHLAVATQEPSVAPEPEPAVVARVIQPAYREPPASHARTTIWEHDERNEQPSAITPQSERRRPEQPPTEFEDDFVLPPPLPELEPRVQEQSGRHALPRPHNEHAAPVRRPEARREHVEQPVADEFGDQPLFAASPLPPVEDYEIDSPPGAPNARALPGFRLERICQTCRDFRPSDNGERGWCNNKWAFNHRRMVDADDLACRNSLGSWWTPKDDVWRRDGDISRHAQQTPRVDQWLFGASSDENERRRSSS
ncbi:MAG TPA: hypothetical protein VFP05_03600 [Thermomicrobiales bacterium]|nr:hypothetical protein [Thermomicrobiales bacterium]